MTNLTSLSVFGSMSPSIYVMVVIDLILKGVALYKSARRGQKVWFVALLLVNSMGILPAIYLFLSRDFQFSKAAEPKKVVVKKSKKSKR